MKAVGLRLPVDRIRKRLMRLRETCRASDFKAELDDYTTRTLKDAMNHTPVRRPSLITRAQRIQYNHRVNFIPSYHELLDPSLRIKDGQPWLYFGGKWYRPNSHRIPAAAWSAFQELNAERERRMQMSEADFIAYRVQARFLYRKSWWQVGLSLNLAVLASAGVQDSVTRRRNPTTSPAKAYGVARGGKNTISYAIFNPFLAQQSQESRYANFDPQEILQQAATRNRPAFIRKVENHVRRNIAAAKKSA